MVEQEKPRTALGCYRVLDLSGVMGLYCGQLLGTLGADVIKIERPRGDPARNIGPFFHDIPDRQRSLFWMAFNTNKRGITLDIETADGRDILGRLVKSADAVIESFPPGYMDELGLSYANLEKINPRIVMTSITPFGQTGPHRHYKASDLVCWAMGGLLYMTGELGMPPVHISHIPSSYLLGGMDGAWATAMALYGRGVSGVGQHIDVSIQESVIRTGASLYEHKQVTGAEIERGSGFRVAESGVIRRSVWQARDGYISVMIFTGQFGAPLTPKLVEWLDEEGMADDYLRGIKWGELDWRHISQEEGDKIHDYFARFFKTKTKDDLLREAVRRRIMLQPLSTPKDILKHPQLEARDYWQTLEHPDLGTALSYPGHFSTMSGTPGRLWRRAPRIGEHNQEIYRQELGFSSSELVTLTEAGVI